MTVPISTPDHNAETEIEDPQLSTSEDAESDAKIMRFGPDGDTGYLPVEFVHMTLPYRKPDQPFWVRTNGSARLSITAGEFIDHEGKAQRFVPYGKHARAALLYLMTEVKRSGSRDIVIGSSFRSFAKAAGIPASGVNARDVVNQLRALLRATVAFSNVERGEGQLKITEGQYVVADTAQLWIDVRKEHLDDDGLLTSTVRISESLFSSIMSDRTRPIDLTKYAQLAKGKSPMAMDIFIWLSSRFYTLERSPRLETRITWEQLHNQFGSDSSIGKFKQNFARALELVLEVEVGGRVEIVSEGTQRKGFKGVILRRSPGAITSNRNGELPPIDPRADGS
ncbi:replication protein RepA [Paenarthrobacter sp. NPDC090522]|uniref:replication protein RepA n=1 Tax=Paenarthrobacter sp. NPDC090522 TaxID=3364383 RepID=UPI003825208E